MSNALKKKVKQKDKSNISDFDKKSAGKKDVSLPVNMDKEIHVLEFVIIATFVCSLIYGMVRIGSISSAIIMCICSTVIVAFAGIIILAVVMIARIMRKGKR